MALFIYIFISFPTFLQLVLNRVLMLGSATQTIIGRPILPDAAVHAVVEEHVSVAVKALFIYLLIIFLGKRYSSLYVITKGIIKRGYKFLANIAQKPCFP